MHGVDTLSGYVCPVAKTQQHYTVRGGRNCSNKRGRPVRATRNMAITNWTTSIALCAVLCAALVVRAWDVRLANGATENVGRVEAYLNNTWHAVCSSGFSSEDAGVLCRELGYANAVVVQYRGQLYYGSPLPGSAIACNLSCFGDETDLSDCPGTFTSGYAPGSCADVVGVQCRLEQPQKPPTLPVRLSCPARNAKGSCRACPLQRAPAPKQCAAQPAVEGIVQIFYGGQWRSVASKGWSAMDATVVCGELGYPLALGIPTMQELWPNFNGSACSNATNGSEACDSITIAENDQFRESLRSAYLKTVKCTGTETRLLDCYFPAFGPTSNPSLTVATVRCGFQPHPGCSNEASGIIWGGGGGGGGG